MFHQYQDADATIISGVTIRTKRHLNPNGCLGGRMGVDANILPFTCIEEDDFVMTTKLFEQHPDILKKLIDAPEIRRILYNEGDALMVIYP
jgi:hypothetical protein